MDIETLLLQTRETLLGHKSTELKSACKTLKLTNYSAQKKSVLVDRIDDALNPYRLASSIVIRRHELDEQYQRLKPKTKEEGVFGVAAIRKALKDTYDKDRKSYDVVQACSNLIIAALTFYQPITIATGLLKTFKESLTLLDEYPSELKESLEKAMVRACMQVRKDNTAEYAQTTEDRILNKASVVIDSPKVIAWAVENLESPAEYNRAIALAILSGRRMVEIFGTAVYSKRDNLIHMDGLAKRKGVNSPSTCTFVPLCDVDSWLASIAKLKRGYTPERVNGNISAYISRGCKPLFQSLGINKFKDTRDVYVGVIVATYLADGVNETAAVLKTSKFMGHEGLVTTFNYLKCKCQPLPEIRPLP